MRPLVQYGIDVVLAPLGFAPGEITFTWNPLWQMSDLEQAEIEKKRAETDAIYIQAGVVSAEEIALSRFGGDAYSTDTVLDMEKRAELAAMPEPEPEPIIPQPDPQLPLPLQPEENENG